MGSNKTIVRISGFVLWIISTLLCKTVRICFVNGTFFEKANDQNYLVAFWHSSMLMGWYVHRPKSTRSVSALVSQSSDGEVLASVLERWNYTMIRGSSHVGGKEAMHLMIDAVANGSSLCVTPDGPTGPRHVMKMGAVRAAQQAGVPLILAGIAMKRKKRLRSWDRFEIPMPWTSACVCYSDPVVIEKQLEGAALDEVLEKCQSQMLLLQQQAEGFSPKDFQPEQR
ncbi:MAG: lysophospholipid acyltransferase family protein [Bacteroidota bacterium]|nr:lysophospholipid acyltransferase family protein [Bacteroidota bacterium]